MILSFPKRTALFILHAAARIIGLFTFREVHDPLVLGFDDTFHTGLRDLFRGWR